MAEMRDCPECGVTLPPDALRGLCPRCLMGAAFSVAATGPHRPSGGASRPDTPPVNLAEFRDAVLGLGLIDAPTLERLAAGAVGNVERLARDLVRAAHLTPHQAGALLQGKGRGLAIGRYLVLEKLGQGGMGVVFKARNRESRRVVALKILPPSFARDPDAVHRFRREFEVAAGLSHPNIVAAIDAAEDRGVQFLTMEYVNGHNLDDLVGAVGPLPIKLAINCAIQAATGLAAAHAGGIVHRDIKPANLMLDATGLVRVLDLGLARVISAASPLGRATAGPLTQTGAYLGTVDFMAPEQADDSKRADSRADIYSLACTLYFLLTGQAPFGGDSALKRLMAHQNQQAPSLHASRSDVPAALEAAYQTMMAKRPDDRPRSMVQVIELLQSCRSSSQEAREARSGLKRAFAETVLKRASPRGRERSPNASIYARPAPEDQLHVDPDLNLEDLVTDFREERPRPPLAEEKLPPLLPRGVVPPRPSSSSSPRPLVPILLGVLASSLAIGVFLRPTSRPEPAPGTGTAPMGIDAPKPSAAGSPLGESSGPAMQPDRPARETPTVPVTPPAPLRVLYTDEFNDAASGWAVNDSMGYADGAYYLEAQDTGQWAWNARGSLIHFSCEAVGRILRDKPGGRGSWGLLVLGRERGFQALIDNDAQLWIQPSFWTSDKRPGDPRIGPIVHPAIRPGNTFNTLRLNVRRRKLEVLVNNILVHDPIAIDWDLTPALVEIGLWCDAPRVRAEYDRIEIKELPPDGVPSGMSPIGSWAWQGDRRTDIQPGGMIKDNFWPKARWTQAGSILSLAFEDPGHPDRGTWVDRVELDQEGTHFRGGNQEGAGVSGFRIPPKAVLNSAGFVMVPVPAGAFDMGTSPAHVEAFLRAHPNARRDLFSDEQPVRRVRITRPFYLGATEVTVGEFRRFVEATGYKTEAERDGKGALTTGDAGNYVVDASLNWKSPGFEQSDEHPVVNVSWNDAKAFCEWLGRQDGKTYRLPTEAEWEYACRVGVSSRYANGDDPETLVAIGNVADATARDKYPAWITIVGRDDFVQTAPVAQFRPNALGIYDMTGNVWEWCSDRYDATYYGRGVEADPAGPEEGDWRVRRGGGWNYDPPSCRPTDRAADAPDRRLTFVGFRVARDFAPGELIPTPSPAPTAPSKEPSVQPPF